MRGLLATAAKLGVQSFFWKCDDFTAPAYRYLHLDTGHLGQQLNLAAIQLRLGVSGTAGFFDDRVNDVLSIPRDETVLCITTLGVPTESELQ